MTGCREGCACFLAAVCAFLMGVAGETIDRMEFSRSRRFSGVGKLALLLMLAWWFLISIVKTYLSELCLARL